MSIMFDEIDGILSKLENQKTPTYPRLDNTNLPPVGVLGQVVVADDDLMYTFLDDAWVDITA